MDSGIRIEFASDKDWPQIQELLNQHALPTEGLETHLPHTLVARSHNAMVGCVALEVYGRAALLRSLAVGVNAQGQGIGQRLTCSVLDLARQLDVDEVFLLTTTADQFFPRFGFCEVARKSAPQSLKNSLEFTKLCPDSAITMQLRLAE